MERAEAEQLRDRMSAEHPDRATHSFIVSERDGEWTVAKVALPPAIGLTDSALAQRQPVHDHEPTDLPGGINPGAAGF
jgi:hypothetical protein